MSDNRPKEHQRTYLGDAVYVEVMNGMLSLTTHDGVKCMEQIYLEPQVMDALVAYYEAAKKAVSS